MKLHCLDNFGFKNVYVAPNLDLDPNIIGDDCESDNEDESLTKNSIENEYNDHVNFI